jgi:hypothetical protein
MNKGQHDAGQSSGAAACAVSRSQSTPTAAGTGFGFESVGIGAQADIDSKRAIESHCDFKDKDNRVLFLYTRGGERAPL